jgi:hypothetical protein
MTMPDTFRNLTQAAALTFVLAFATSATAQDGTRPGNGAWIPAESA